VILPAIDAVSFITKVAFTTWLPSLIEIETGAPIGEEVFATSLFCRAIGGKFVQEFFAGAAGAGGKLVARTGGY
jgi:hypothetical protein